MKGFTTIMIFLSNRLEFYLFWKKKVQNLTQPLILCLWKICLPVTNVLILFITPIALQVSTVTGIEISLNAYIANLKYHYLCTDPPSERVSTAVTKVMLRRVISHNSSQMDSPEIKSASQTASWGGNIPLQFFIDLHSFSPWYFPRFAPPSLSSIALSGASPCVFDDERHNIHQVREKSVE